ncbi:hypothetical protein KQI63_13230 [bacterium]|nr:hypothetical protein [bacterium]
MSATLLRNLLFAGLMVHAIGQLMGVVPALGLFGAGGASGPDWLQRWSVESGVLSHALSPKANHAVGLVLYSLAFLGFLLGALALQGWGVPHAGWRTILLWASVFSMMALILYWNGLIWLFPHKIGDIAVNIFCIVAVYIAQWPDETMIGIG